MKRTRFKIARTALFAGALVAAPATQATSPFELRIDVNLDGVDAVVGLSSFEDSIDEIQFSRLSQRTDYQGNEAVSVELFLRGLETILTFTTQGSGVLDFSVFAPSGQGIPIGPSGSTVTFNPRNPGANVVEQRRDTLEQLKDYLKENKTALKSILTALTRFSPIDPLAGNPESLFSRKQKGDVDHGFTHKVSQIWGCGTSAFNFHSDEPILLAATGEIGDIFADAQARAAELHAQNEANIGLIYSNTTADTANGSFKSTGFILPFSYTAKLDSNPGHKVRIDFPVSWTDVEGAQAYSLGLGLAYTFPVSDVWTLTPAVGAGATASLDLLAAGGVSSYSLTSAYTWRLGNWALSMGNSLGQYESLDFKIGDVEAAADVSNQVISNGFMLTGPNSLIANNLVIEYSFMNTQIGGDDVYVDAMNEVGVAVGFIDSEMGVIDSHLKAGVSYVMADGLGGDVNSLKLNLQYRF